LRKHKNRHSVEFDENIAVRTDSGLFDGHTSNNPERNAEQEELKKLVMSEVDKLPEDQKQILILKEIDGLSYKEIAEVVGIPQGTVMSRLYYARKRLQEALEGKDV
jgi:RNA polymerase sigma-70 factor (ECF subfamily)